MYFRDTKTEGKKTSFRPYRHFNVNKLGVADAGTLKHFCGEGIEFFLEYSSKQSRNTKTEKKHLAI